MGSEQKQKLTPSVSDGKHVTHWAVAVIVMLLLVWVAVEATTSWRISAKEEEFYLLQSLNLEGGPLHETSNLKKRQAIRVPHIGDDTLSFAVRLGQDVVSRLGRLERNLERSGIKVTPGTPAQGQLIDSLPSPEALQLNEASLVATKASLHLSHELCQKFGLGEEQCGGLITTLSLKKTPLAEKCLKETRCKASKYRSADGTCNNLKHSNWGRSLTAYRRLLRPQYSDGVQGLRVSTQGPPLPSARQVSTALVSDLNRPDARHTLALMEWGEFIGHDLSHTPTSKMASSGNPILCCSHDGYDLSPRFLHPLCSPIPIPRNDPFYSKHGQSCMTYVRSMSTMRSDCSFGPVEQMNQATHFLDGSMIYGPTTSVAKSLRLLEEGRLTTSEQNGKQLLPSSGNRAKYCNTESNEGPCYMSGDSRVNNHPLLSVMHILWLREHNRLATELASLNPHWSDEELYQEARKIVIAELQHITYNEWLPIILGNDFMKTPAMDVRRNDFSTVYDENMDPSVSNSFASAGFGFISSMMQGNIRLERDNLNGSANTSGNRITEVADNLDMYVSHMVTKNSQSVDRYFADELTKMLFKGSSPYGFDLVSLDIQKGRDHGLPGYNKYRQHCGLPLARKFEDFYDKIPKSVVRKLKTLYNHVNDVDILIGGISERPVKGSLLGPTFRCIVGEQFVRLRLTDRFFYDLGNKSHSFSKDQLNEIKKASLSRIICDNSDTLTSLQPMVFQSPTSGNSVAPCNGSTIARLNLSLWKEDLEDRSTNR